MHLLVSLFFALCFFSSSSINALAAETRSSSSKKAKNAVSASKKKIAKAPVITVRGSKKRKGTTKKAQSLTPPANAIMSPPNREVLAPVAIDLRGGQAHFSEMPHFSAIYKGKVTGISIAQQFIFYSLDPALQKMVYALVDRAPSPHLAVVAMEPTTGRILAMAGKSISIPDILTHSKFPAASLFKVITASAAVEKGKVDPDSLINYRGGTHLLNQSNALPDPSRDRLSMTVMDALGKSCNPVFARIALKYLSTGSLREYANSFGFNGPLGFEVNLPISSAYIPEDAYELGRTAAGFGEVRLSPIHAAALMAGMANGGLLPRPSIVDQVVNKDGSTAYTRKSVFLKRMLKPASALEVFEMMEATTTTGTSRRAFMIGKERATSFRAVGKTGTLRGDNPQGLNNWFIGAAPLEHPKIVVAVIVVNPATASTKASQIAKQVMTSYLK